MDFGNGSLSVRKYVRTLAELGAQSGCSLDLGDRRQGGFCHREADIHDNVGTSSREGTFSP